jgi:hypothetical protein
MGERVRARRGGELAEAIAMPAEAMVERAGGCGPTCGSCSVGR